MNEMQAGKLCMLAKEIGFEECQDGLVEDCEALIGAAEGEDYDDFIDRLTDVVIAVNQVVFTLPEKKQKQYTEALGAKMKELTGVGSDYDEEDIDPDDLS